MKRVLFFLFLVSPLAFASDPIVMQPSSDVSCTTSGVRLITSNPLRRYLLLVNKGTAQVNVAPNSAPSGTAGVPILSGQNYEQNVSAGANAWYCTSQSGTNVVTVMEGY